MQKTFGYFYNLLHVRKYRKLVDNLVRNEINDDIMVNYVNIITQINFV